MGGRGSGSGGGGKSGGNGFKSNDATLKAGRGILDVPEWLGQRINDDAMKYNWTLDLDQKSGGLGRDYTKIKVERVLGESAKAVKVELSAATLFNASPRTFSAWIPKSQLNLKKK